MKKTRRRNWRLKKPPLFNVFLSNDFLRSPAADGGEGGDGSAVAVRGVRVRMIVRHPALLAPSASLPSAHSFFLFDKMCQRRSTNYNALLLKSELWFGTHVVPEFVIVRAMLPFLLHFPNLCREISISRFPRGGEREQRVKGKFRIYGAGSREREGIHLRRPSTAPRSAPIPDFPRVSTFPVRLTPDTHWERRNAESLSVSH